MASADMDDATFALIQQMLADENPYVSDGGDGDGAEDDSGSDSDYGTQKKRKNKQSTKTNPRKRPAKPTKQTSNDENSPAAADMPSNNNVDALTASGRRVRKDKGKERAKARPWDEQEEAKFIEALHLHGRDWKKCAEHVGTRDARAITSHAQKYFIKLCLQGKKLPSKVAESGDGYTLSGKPLDPSSAAARAYGFKPDSLQEIRETEAAAGVVLDGQQDEGTATNPTQQQQDDADNADNGVQGDTPAVDTVNQPGEPHQDTDTTKNTTKKHTPSKRTKKATARTRDASHSSSSPPSAADAPTQGPTEYARNRPRREVKQRHVYGQTTESLQLMKCVDFVGPIASGAPLAQPFSVTVRSEAALLMDLHSHLSSCEIIGLLGGLWDPETRAITVVRAYPCHRMEGSHSLTSVELDPAAEVATRTLMEQQGLVPVGWYHSHPIFEPVPSAKDAENQRNYQALFSSDNTNAAPFLGAIVSPYDCMLPSEASVIKWFVVRNRGTELMPYNVVTATEAPVGALDENTESACKDVITLVKDDIGRIDLTEMWRAFRRLDGGMPAGGPCTKLAKLRAALSCHLDTAEHEMAAEALLDRVSKHIQTEWGLDLGY